MATTSTLTTSDLFVFTEAVKTFLVKAGGLTSDSAVDLWEGIEEACADLVPDDYGAFLATLRRTLRAEVACLRSDGLI